MVVLAAAGPDGLKELVASNKGYLKVEGEIWDYVGSQNNLSITDSQISLTAPPGATRALIEVRTAPVYFVETPSLTASSTVGRSLEIGDTLPVHGRRAIQNLRFVRQNTTSAALFVTYYRIIAPNEEA